MLRLSILGFDAVMVLLFLWSVALQYNDPDPVQWMVLYGAAAVTSGVWAVRGVPRALPGIVGGAALLWATWIFTHMHLGVPLSTALTDWGMHSEGSEESREIGGLLIVTAYMGVLLSWPSPPEIED